ncbi:glycosyltransferase [Salinimicrobium sp. HB62]|uniref:glycosyltransferase n=1 Tax=Salinimicrobium sp. HB62 TaxID=3077781 RepID=UPI002D79A294|nr:glycosyltransferase [Salinimicrobium sp. HB62]
MNIALVSPSRNAYSETFIKAHTNYLKGNIFHYYSGEVPTKLEGGLVINSRKKRILDIVKGHYRLNQFSLEEQALITSFKKNKIELVFAEYGGTGEMMVPVCKELKIPLIVHFHGFDAARKDQLDIYENYRSVFEYAEYIICVSRKMEKDLLDLGCPRSKLKYNVYGPHSDFLKISPKFSKPQFIAVGRFVDKKAPYYLILSFLEVVKEFKEAKLIIAGDGELWNTCKNLRDFYGLKDHVELPGIINPGQFQKYLDESLAFVQHSVTAENGDTEGTPVSILEASAAGLPVIATKHAGIPDIIIHGETGLLVEEHDVKSMAENLKRVLRDRSIARELGEKGKQNIIENYTIGRHISVLDGLIQKAVQNS